MQFHLQRNILMSLISQELLHRKITLIFTGFKRIFNLQKSSMDNITLLTNIKNLLNKRDLFQESLLRYTIIKKGKEKSQRMKLL